MVPTILSMFSIVLFLRTGFVVGHAGLLQGLLMVIVAYTIISLTILSILCACGEYVLGLVEAILDIFGSDPELSVSQGVRVLPQGYWYGVLYSSVVLLLCLLVCLVGAKIYSRTSFVILILVTVSLLSIFISSVAVKPRDFIITHKGSGNETLRYNASYTGFSLVTLWIQHQLCHVLFHRVCRHVHQLHRDYGRSQHTPSISIPKGTIVAVFYTFAVYVLLFLLVGATCDRSAFSSSYHHIELGESLGGRVVHLGTRTGQLNAVASLVTVFYLLAYAAVDLACLALEWASAPNFRPTFQLFSWHTCLLGIVSCLVMMFVINPMYSSGSIYLLMLDVRKDHVKFWRPQILLMVANPRSSCQLILFINQLKKGGLYVLGHVQLGDLDSLPSDPVQQQYNFWLRLVDKLGVKAFVDLTLCTPEDFFLQDSAFCDASMELGSEGEYNFGVDLPSLQAHFPPVRHVESPRWLSPEEYVGIISDAIKMNKNVCVGRYFFQLEGEDKDSKVDGSERTIDVWPLNLLQPGSRDYEDVCSLFLLQMACVLNMSNKWRHARMRIFLNVETESSDQGWVVNEETFRELLKKLRIRASIKIVPWDSVVQHHLQPEERRLNKLCPRTSCPQ
ncbi:hypothetical protein F7725_006571 [Dissostichus mawsoni]|uniref:Solute carrier family 12 member 9 n=1 Tax=Dissostichus mawsoni TaxID=36200 RepID=A0A7J5XW28_DISMA|nr:hypothetical protein F7725_006571 [Dissostichus mawsoni]